MSHDNIVNSIEGRWGLFVWADSFGKFTIYGHFTISFLLQNTPSFGNIVFAGGIMRPLIQTHEGVGGVGGAAREESTRLDSFGSRAELCRAFMAINVDH